MDIYESTSDITFPPLKISLASKDVANAVWDRFGARPDLVLTVEWDGQQYPFVVEQKTLSTPRSLEAAIQQARRYADLSQNQYQPMIMVPYLNSQALDRLIAVEMSGIDLSGNGVVLVPKKLFVYRTGEKNRFPASTPIRNVYRGTTSLVSRVLFARSTFSSVTEISEEIRRRGGRITMSTVSKALRGLQEDLVVGREEGIRLLQPARLLDLLVRNYRSPNVRRRVSGRVEDAASALQKFTVNARELRLSVAGDLPSRYVVMPSSEEIISVYTSSIGELLRGVNFRETARFPNISLLETRDQTVYFDRREADGFYWISPLETYLELATGGKREQEAARQVRSDLLNFRYQDR